jgi:hypothetical protein
MTTSPCLLLTCRLFMALYSMPIPNTGACKLGNRRAAVR